MQHEGRLGTLSGSNGDGKNGMNGTNGKNGKLFNRSCPVKCTNTFFPLLSLTRQPPDPILTKTNLPFDTLPDPILAKPSLPLHGPPDPNSGSGLGKMGRKNAKTGLKPLIFGYIVCASPKIDRPLQIPNNPDFEHKIMPQPGICGDLRGPSEGIQRIAEEHSV